MLVLSRKIGQEIHIGDNMILRITSIHGYRIKCVLIIRDASTAP